MNSCINIEDFFTSQNTIDSILESDYAKAELIIDVTKAFERNTYECVYIIDYYKRGLLYVSNNVANLCGGEAMRIMDFGEKFYQCYLPKEELNMLIELNIEGFKLLNALPIEEKKRHTISCSFHIVRDNSKRLVNHKFTPVALTNDGKIWLALCTISLSSANKAGNLMIKKAGASTFYHYSLNDRKWKVRNEVVLTDNERAVLSLSTQGYTMKEIANMICRSVDTVKAYRRSIFQKMHVKNITEALIYAQDRQLI